MDADDNLPSDAPFASWTIDSEERAAYAVARLLSREADVERVKATAAAAIERAEKELARAREFFLPQLSLWMMDHPPRKGGTLHFVTGSFSARKSPEAVKVVDEKALIEWADQHDGLPVTTTTKTTRTVAHADVVALLSKPGQALPPGVTIVPSTTTYRVTGPKEKP